ncbi:MAG TPA: right-handed parallel beta-helix repeat-containing protein, partial [Candidatus Saccharimonadales bacterium]|nr:right-handed parallel beta-helix repeat-containing protein [Candidatus Saccharimonadales bacterium]
GVGGSTTLQQAYDYSTTSPQITLDSSPGAGGLVVQDNATPLVGNLFTVQGNACASASCQYLAVNATGVVIAGSLSVSSTITSTGVITANGGISVGANQTITMAGGTTASRPASPTKGTLYYDTTTNQLVQYNGSKWQAPSKSNTFIVAASNSTQAEKDAADYVATGTDDQNTINSALSALPSSGGSVYLMEGTYTLGTTSISVPDNTTLAGSGSATVLKYANSVGSSTYYAITNSDTTTGTNVTVQNLLIDGNKANQSAGVMNGIYFNHMGSGSSRKGGTISNVTVQNIYSNGRAIYLSLSANNSVIGNNINGSPFGISLLSSTNNEINGNISTANSYGIEVNSSSGNNFAGNVLQNNSSYGIYLYSTSLSNTVVGNTIQSNTYGVSIASSSSNNTISGNNITSNTGSYGIWITGASNNIISLNKIYNNGGSASNNGIYLGSVSTKNSITGNDITDTSCTTTCYAINISDAGSTGNYLASNHFLGDGTHVASINDATSGGNTYSNQPLTENGDASFRNGTDSVTAFQVQSASGTSLFTVNTTGSGTLTLAANVSATANLDVTGSTATKKGTDYATTGLSVDTSFGNTSLVRLTGASAQTIAGIANGRDGYRLTIINAGSTTATLKNNDTTDETTAANLIITGTGGDLSLAVGASVNLVYDSGSSLWRVIGTSSAGGATSTLQQAYDASTTSPQITLDASPGAGGLVVQDNATPLVGNLFTIQSNGGSTKYLQVASSGVVVSTLTSTGLITANGGISLAANQTIAMTGGTTASRPASPTKGTLYYDTSTNNLIQYNGSKWTSAPKSNTFIVAASNSTQAEKDAADYVATGTDDGTTINSALSALPSGGGSVYLMEGTYTLGTTAISVPDNTTLSGAGASTVLTWPNSFGSSTYYAIKNSDTTTGANVTIQNLLIDGNKTNQTTGIFYGIYFNGMGSTNRTGSKISQVIVQNVYDATTSGAGIYMTNSLQNTITNSVINNVGSYGVELYGSSNNNYLNLVTNNTFYNDYYGVYLYGSLSGIVSNNTITGGTQYGVYVANSKSNTIANNTFFSANYSIYLTSNTNNSTITGNNSYNSAFNSIYLNGSPYNNISDNNLNSSGGTTDNNALYLTNSSTNNSIIGNNITDKDLTNNGCTSTCYAINIFDSGSTGNYLADNHLVGDGSHTASINDATASGNTYSNQEKTENGDASFRNGTNSTTAFQIQNASGTSLFTADTTGSGALTLAANVSATANLDVTGSTATKKGTDFATTGLSKDINFGNTSLVRLTGASAQTIAGIANGRDGYRLTIINAGSTTATLKNNDTTDETTAANLIITGTGSDLSLAVGASVNLVYDSGSSLWRVIGTSTTGGATATLQQAYTASTGGTTPEIVLDSTRGGLDIQDATSALGTNLFDVQNNGGTVNYLAVAATGVTVNNLSVATNGSLTFASGSGSFDQSASSGTFKTGTGNISLNGNTTVANGKTLDVGGLGTATGQVYISGSIPTQIGTYAMSNPKDVVVQGQYAYVTDYGNNTLNVFDISNPASPKFISSIATITNGPEQLFVSGKYVFVGFGVMPASLEIYDVSNPSSPFLAGSLSMGGTVDTIYVQGRYAYIGDESPRGIDVVDISNPSRPVKVGFIATSYASPASPWRITGQGHYIYAVITNGASAIEIYDVTDPTNPVLKGTVSKSGVNGDIYVQGRYLYAADQASGISIFDISNPGSPTLVSSYGSGDSGDIYVQGRYAYTTCFYSASHCTHIYDVSNPSAITLVNTTSTSTTPTGIAIQGRYEYTVGTTSLIVYDLGGTYSQQLEAGGITASTINADSNLQVAGDASIVGGLAVGQSLQVTGNIGTSGQVTLQNATNSTSAFQVQNSSSRSLLTVDTTDSNVQVGNTTDGSTIVLAASGNTNSTIQKNMPVGGTVNAHDLVVIDNTTNGQVKTTTTANDTKVFGIATATNTTPQNIVISGTYQVNLLPTNQAISPGDYLVSTTTAGDVDKASGVPPSGTAIGEALQSVAANTGGLIWVYVTPG